MTQSQALELNPVSPEQSEIESYEISSEFLGSEATQVADKHPGRNEDKILGRIDDRPPKFETTDPGADMAAYEKATETEYSLRDTLKEIGAHGVFDGVSGGSEGKGAGTLASRLTSAEVTKSLARLKLETLDDAKLNSAAKVEATKRAIETGLKNANQQVVDYKNNPFRDKELNQMGTTADVIVPIKREDGNLEVVFGHVGDGAIFISRPNSETGQADFEKLTLDHSYARYLMEQGQLDQAQYDEVMNSKQERPNWTETMKQALKYKQAIVNSVGSNKEMTPDISSVILKPGEKLLLATDGLVDNAPPETIKQMLDENWMPEQIMQAIQANKTKDDDVSFEVIEFAAAEAADDLMDEVPDAAKVEQQGQVVEDAEIELALLENKLQTNDPNELAREGGRAALTRRVMDRKRQVWNLKKTYLENRAAVLADQLNISADSDLERELFAASATNPERASDLKKLIDMQDIKAEVEQRIIQLEQEFKALESQELQDIRQEITQQRTAVMHQQPAQQIPPPQVAPIVQSKPSIGKRILGWFRRK